jgi:ABC-type nickel/cobalt efflux system permease component RcnA
MHVSVKLISFACVFVSCLCSCLCVCVFGSVCAFVKLLSTYRNLQLSLLLKDLFAKNSIFKSNYTTCTHTHTHTHTHIHTNQQTHEDMHTLSHTDRTHTHTHTHAHTRTRALSLNKVISFVQAKERLREGV